MTSPPPPLLTVSWCVTLLIGTIGVCAAHRVESIVNLEHWEDIQHFQDGSRIGRVPGLVAFYESDICSDSPLLKEFRELSNSVPDRRLFLLGEHSPALARRITWFDWSEDFDFARRYNVEITEGGNCPVILFFPAGEGARSPVVYTPNERTPTLDNWVWDQLALRTVPIFNTLDVPVDVYWHDGGARLKRVLASQLEPNEHRALNTFMSHVFTVQERSSGRFVDGFEVEKRQSYRLAYGESGSMRDWFLDLAEKKETDLAFWDAMIWSHTRRHLYNQKIPPLLPKFTPLGYAKTTLPAEALRLLQDFYKENKPTASVEQWPRGATQVNFDVVRTKMVMLTQELKTRIADIVRPVLEEWCGCELVYNTMYGIREYFHGAILRNHVDRIETHVVSSIINVWDDLNTDWELELIDFHGRKVKVSQHPGELVMYESSTLIHGRPTPVNGTVYASGFIHFHPVSGWTNKYKTTYDNIIVTPTQRVPVYPVEFAGTPFTGANPYITKGPRVGCEWPFDKCTSTSSSSSS